MSYFLFKARSFLIVAIWVALNVAALSKAAYDNPKNPEGWAWTQIKQGKPADFNERCKTPELDPRANNDAGWKSDCRRLEAKFLIDVMTSAPWGEQVPFVGVHVIGAHVTGDVDLRNARMNRELSIEKSWVDGDVRLDAAQTDRDVIFSGSRVDGIFSAIQFHDGQSLRLWGAQLERDVLLAYAKIDGFVGMDGAIFNSDLNAGVIQVGATLSMNNASFKNVSLMIGRVSGHVAMNGALFDGNMDANELQVGADLFMNNKARFKGMSLIGARIAGNIAMNGVSFDGELNASALQVGASLFMKDGAAFKNVNLVGAKVAGKVDIDRAVVDDDLNASSLQVGGDLSISKANFTEASLAGAKIDGVVKIVETSVAKDFDASSLQSGSHLFINKASLKGLSLIGAKIAGNVGLIDTRFDGELNANLLQVDVNLLMRAGSFFKGVNLVGAKVNGQIDMNNATFDGELDAASLQTGGDVMMQSSIFAQEVVATFAKIGGSLDLRGSTFAGLDLSGASVAGDLVLGASDKSRLSTVWRNSQSKPGDLILANTHVGNLIAARDAWPEKGHLHLNGFAFTRLGGLTEDQASEPRNREPKRWDEWAKLDSHYSSHPYRQLAAAFAAAGDQDLADEIRYARHVREQENLRGTDWVWSWPLRFVAGFGVYPHWVLYWIAGVSLAGAAYLWKFSKGVRDGNHGVVWCWGASLARLLPVITINKEFTDFFDDPKRERLSGLQTFVFSFVGVLGWFLAAILIAAASGITSKS